MKFSEGDRILVKRTGEEGYVVKLLGNDLIEININNLSFPIYQTEIDHPYLKWFTEQKKQTNISNEIKKDTEIIIKTHKGITLTFIPLLIPDFFEEKVASFKIYLLNETAIQLDFEYEVRNKINEIIFQHKGFVYPFQSFFLHTLSWEEMAAIPKFNCLFINNKEPDLQPIQCFLKIKSLQLFEFIEQIRIQNKPSFSQLFSDGIFIKKEKIAAHLPINILKNKSFNHFHQFNDKPANNSSVIDLHFEQIKHNYDRKISPEAILNIQLTELQKFIQQALLYKKERIIIIHGIGKGKLKEAVHQQLKNNKEVIKYSNDWMGAYGFGATEVWFK